MRKLPWDDDELLLVETLCVDLLHWYKHEESSSWDRCLFCDCFKKVVGEDMYSHTSCDLCPWIVFEGETCCGYVRGKRFGLSEIVSGMKGRHNWDIDVLRSRLSLEWNALRRTMLKEWIRRIRISRARRGWCEQITVE